MLKVEWASAHTEAMNVVLAISAYDRRGLLRDLSDVLAVERLSIDAATTRTDHETAARAFRAHGCGRATLSSSRACCAA